MPRRAAQKQLSGTAAHGWLPLLGRASRWLALLVVVFCLFVCLFGESFLFVCFTFKEISQYARFLVSLETRT